MTRIVFITLEEVPYGFAIAGFEQIMTGVGEARNRLLETTEDAEVGVVIIDERLLKQIDEETLQQLHEQWQGILLVLPTPIDTAPLEEDYLQKLIRRALGYRVRIRE